ncbi:hypothetical protein GBA52_006885 [Prunus armeniaca]|nr:hypothetical protein GBA52_006885 [Prunus armeniaca]
MVQIPGNGGVILKTPCNVSAGDERASCNVQRDLIRLGRVCRGSFKALSIVTVRLYDHGAIFAKTPFFPLFGW